jgi:Flp pilus assembly protein CpaB
MFRRSPRALALWGAAVVVALVTTVVVASDLAALHRRAAGLGPTVTAVVARRDLPVGTDVRAIDVEERRAYRSQLPAGAVAGRAAVVGRVVAAPVLRGGFVVTANLAPRHRTGLDGIVPPGMRAMRVVVTDAIRPRAGAAVDVLATFDTQSGAASGKDTTTVVVAAGVEVLGTDTRAQGGSHGDTLGVTLLVASALAPKLAFAQANGVVTLALVPPEDAASR